MFFARVLLSIVPLHVNQTNISHMHSRFDHVSTPGARLIFKLCLEVQIHGS
jgi:hypothetical protein